MPKPRRTAAARAVSILARGAILGSLVACSGGESVEPRSDRRGTAEAAQRLERRAAEAPLDHDAWARMGYRLDWRGFPPVTQGQRIAFLEPADDIVIVQETGSILSVLEADTGALRWSNELANRLTRFTGILRDQDRIFAAAEAELHVLNIDTGALIDRQGFELVVNTRPIQFGNLLVFGTAGGVLAGHLTTFGVQAWANASTGSINVDPVRIDNAVGAITQSGQVFFVDGMSGSLAGRARVFDGAAADPAVGEGLMFIASLDQSVYAIAPTGQIVWRYRTGDPLRQRPVYHDGTVYVAVPAEGLVALNAGTGQARWRTPDIRGHVVAQRDATLIVWDGDAATAHVVRAADGTLETSIPLPGTQMLVAHGFVDGPIYLVADNGVIARLIPRT